MLKFNIFIWKHSPILRLLLPFIAGILLQFHCNIGWKITACIFISALILLAIFALLPTFLQFSLRWLIGLSIHLFFISIGMGLCSIKQGRIDNRLLTKTSTVHYYVLATLREPLVEKAKTYKALASIEMIKNDGSKKAGGDALLYFQKDSIQPFLHYGSRIIIHQALQPISNSGNPGSFDYRQYCAFQHIYYQVYLNEKGYQILASENKNFFDESILKMRSFVLNSLRENIAHSDALGIAEALLIGFRTDLDQDLVQAYSNTGVVHIIAISGLHIAMIYGLILFFLQPFRNRAWIKWLKPLLVLLIIWGFTFIAGSAPSIMRSAVMFSFIIVGESFSKRINIYNNLSASAFVILLFNPFSLWDVGFLLSYAAVLSIVIFSKHINNWLIFSNKILKFIWQMCAVTLSAQILTLPLILFYFHQFPGLFLFSNLIVVPLSGLILYFELLLLVLSPFPSIAVHVGMVTGMAISRMNDFILRINSIPHANFQFIYVSVLQTVILYFIIGGLSYWLLRKQKAALFFAFSSLLLFFMLRAVDIIQKGQQQKLIVYNIPRHKAMDIMEGRNLQFIGDSIIQQDGFLYNFHVKPCRILNRITAVNQLLSINYQPELICSSHRKVILIDSSIYPSIVDKRIKVDAIILSKNPKLNIRQLAAVFDCNEFVFDASNSLWKINQWKKDCENLHLRHHSIPEQGAFVMEL